MKKSVYIFAVVLIATTLFSCSEASRAVSANRDLIEEISSQLDTVSSAATLHEIVLTRLSEGQAAIKEKFPATDLSADDMMEIAKMNNELVDKINVVSKKINGR